MCITIDFLQEEGRVFFNIWLYMERRKALAAGERGESILL
jgi:hypothetical protein